MNFSEEQLIELYVTERFFAVEIDRIWRVTTGVYMPEGSMSRPNIKCKINGKEVMVLYPKYKDFKGYLIEDVEKHVISYNISLFPAPKIKVKKKLPVAAYRRAVRTTVAPNTMDQLIIDELIGRPGNNTI